MRRAGCHISLGSQWEVTTPISYHEVGPLRHQVAHQLMVSIIVPHLKILFSDFGLEIWPKYVVKLNSLNEGANVLSA